MALPGSETIIVGPYNVTWNSVTVGMMEGEQGVPTLRQMTKAKRVDNTDRYGQTLLTAIDLGVEYEAHYTCMEYRAGSIAAFWPFGTFGRLGVIGKLYDAMAAPLVFTAVSGTSAAATPATLTAALAILSPGYDAQLLYGPMVRTVPIRQSLLPYTSGVVLFFTQT